MGRRFGGSEFFLSFACFLRSTLGLVLWDGVCWDVLGSERGRAVVSPLASWCMWIVCVTPIYSH